MNWSEAKYDYLIDILLNDEECEIGYKWQALQEYIKRNKQLEEFMDKLDALTKEQEEYLKAHNEYKNECLRRL